MIGHRANTDQHGKLSSCSTLLNIYISIHPYVEFNYVQHGSLHPTRDSCLYHHRHPEHAKGPLSPPSLRRS